MLGGRRHSILQVVTGPNKQRRFWAATGPIRVRGSFKTDSANPSSTPVVAQQGGAGARADARWADAERARADPSDLRWCRRWCVCTLQAGRLLVARPAALRRPPSHAARVKIMPPLPPSSLRAPRRPGTRLVRIICLGAFAALSESSIIAASAMEPAPASPPESCPSFAPGSNAPPLSLPVGNECCGGEGSIAFCATGRLECKPDEVGVCAFYWAESEPSTYNQCDIIENPTPELGGTCQPECPDSGEFVECVVPKGSSFDCCWCQPNPTYEPYEPVTCAGGAPGSEGLVVRLVPPAPAPAPAIEN
jgi:hypothetical protein